ncbi:MAG: type II secretion system F family protein [Maritimibacter sp.]
MDDIFDPLDAAALTDPSRLILLLVGAAALFLLLGAGGLVAYRDRKAARLRALRGDMTDMRQELGLSKGLEQAPSGWKKALVPEDASERAQIRFQLEKIGFKRADAVELFFLIRLMLALVIPFLVIVTVGAAKAGALPPSLVERVIETPTLRIFQIIAVGAAIGFWGPGYWLKGQIKKRQNAIRAAFPNALDLVQISIEAGLGFDAAVARVGDELGRVAPEVAYEFLVLQMEVQAGRDREAAMFDMAERMGIDEAKSFALVIVQSMQFGTSLTASLMTYAAEMRHMRELSAQEKANKLPVQMSGVMSILMLPALFLITLTPIIIRYMSMY